MISTTVLLITILLALFLILLTRNNKYTITNKVPKKQFIIRQKLIPINPQYLVDNSDLQYYHQEIQNNPNEFFDILDYDLDEILGQPIDTRQDRPDNIHHERFGLHGPDNRHIERFTNHVIQDIIRDDTQSVHDTIIQNQIKQEYNNHVLDGGSNGHDGTLEEIIKYNPEKSNDISAIIQQIQVRNSNVYNIKDDEINVLKKVWSNGNDNVKAQVIKELLDCKQERGGIYCPTGVVTRIIQSNFIENPENMPKTPNMFKKEMLNKASILKDKNPDMSDESFTTLLLNEYKSDYKDILTEPEIKTITDEWINYI